MQIEKSPLFFEGKLSARHLHIIVLWNPDRICRLFVPEFPTLGFIDGKTREEAQARLLPEIEALINGGEKPSAWTLGTYVMRG